MDNKLVEEFFATYELTKVDPKEGPTPDLETLNLIEDKLREMSDPLLAAEMDPDQRSRFYSKRTADLADVLYETAEALQESPAIVKAIGTAPGVFEDIAAQDLAIGGVIQVLQNLHAGADTAMLLCAGEAHAFLANLETTLASVLKDPNVDHQRRVAIDAKFTDAKSRLQQLREKSETTLQADRSLLDQSEQVAKATSELEMDDLVRQLIRSAMQDNAPKKTTPITPTK